MKLGPRRNYHKGRALSVITNLRMELFQALDITHLAASPGDRVLGQQEAEAGAGDRPVVGEREHGGHVAHQRRPGLQPDQSQLS